MGEITLMNRWGQTVICFPRTEAFEGKTVILFEGTHYVFDYASAATARYYFVEQPFAEYVS